VSFATRTAFVDTVDGDDRDDRTERFLRIDAHLRRDIGHDGRLEVEAMRSPARDHLRAPGDGVLDVPGHSLDCSALTSGPICVSCRAGRPLSASRALGKLVRELVGDRAVDHDPLGRHTDLPLVHERAKVRRRQPPASRSASPKTTSGALPPSSSRTRLSGARPSRPTTVPPASACELTAAGRLGRPPISERAVAAANFGAFMHQGQICSRPSGS